METLIVIFGVTGDLAKRKLFPALYGLYAQKLLKNFSIVGIGRKPLKDKDLRAVAKKAVKGKYANAFLKNIFYLQGEFDSDELYHRLEKTAAKARNVLYYLATPHSLFHVISQGIKKTGLHEEKKGFRRIIFEKPFGHDLVSAQKLNRDLRSVWQESQIYRIDHYVGKEIIQNILVLRFTNAIFEHLCNNTYVDHVQITVAETLGVEERGGYYDKTGALRDMVQNHLLQMLCLIAMEPPSSLNADDTRDEKVKVLRSLEPLNGQAVSTNVVAGQYEGYTKEPKVERSSKTETFVALKTAVHNLRWGGVPFYLRTGKKFWKAFAEINIVLKDLPCVLFCQLPNQTLNSNRITIRIQPDEGISLQFNTKLPGHDLKIGPERMDFCHACEYGPTSTKAYENLLHDALTGDATLFTRWDEVEASWRFIDQITEAWKKQKKLFVYKQGAPSRMEAEELVKKDRREWINS